jgi:hypothetical protein
MPFDPSSLFLISNRCRGSERSARANCYCVQLLVGERSETERSHAHATPLCHVCQLRMIMPLMPLLPLLPLPMPMLIVPDANRTTNTIRHDISAPPGETLVDRRHGQRRARRGEYAIHDTCIILCHVLYMHMHMQTSIHVHACPRCIDSADLILHPRSVVYILCMLKLIGNQASKQ